MLRFAALNKSLSEGAATTDQDGDHQPSRTKEAQESAALGKYNKALGLQQSGKLSEARDSYGELLELPLVASEDFDNPTGLRLKYLSLKNLAAIAIEDGNKDEALSFYVQASSVDSTDVVLWYHMGRTALSERRLALARHAFEEALSLHSDYWPCVDSLCTVLFAIGDYHSCLNAILTALELDDSYEKGLAYLQYMNEHESWLPQWKDEPWLMFKHLKNPMSADIQKMYVDEAVELRPKADSQDAPVEKPLLKLTSLSWSSLGSDLLTLWDSLKSSAVLAPLSASVSLSDAIANVSSDDFCKAAKTQLAKDRKTAAASSEAVDMEQLGRQGLKRKHAQAQTSTSPQLGNGSSSSPGTPKRRSTRNRATGKKESSDSPPCSEVLRRYLPPQLCSPPSTTSLSTPSPGRQRHMSSMASQRHILFASDMSSAEEISDFLCQHVDNQGLVDLVIKYITNLACNRRGLIWPRSLRKVYCQLYSVVRPCISPPCYEARAEDTKRVTELAWAALIACELALDQFTSQKADTSKGSTHPPKLLDMLGGKFGADIPFLVSCTIPADFMGIEFATRVYWLAGHVATQIGELPAAIENFCKALYAVELDASADEEHVESTGTPLRIFSLKNCVHNPLVSSGAIRQRIDTVTKQKTFDEIKENFSSGNHEKVIDTLSPLLDEHPLSPNKHEAPMELLTSNSSSLERHKQLLLLQDAYYHLARYQECLRCAEVNLSDVLRANDNIEPCLDTLMKILQILPKCLNKPSTSLSCLSSISQWRLVNSLFQVIDYVSSNMESCQEKLPIALPWLVLHVIVKQAVPPPATPDPSAKEQIPPPADSAAKEAKSSTGPEQLDDGGDVGGNVELESMPLEGSNDSTSDSAGLAVSLALSPKRSITPPPLPSVNSFSTVSNSSTVSSSLSTAEEDPLPPHFRILQVAHETLGRSGLCCSMEGRLLLVMVKEIKHILPAIESAKDELIRELEQCYFCLFGHPNKKYKARRLEDHGSSQIELTWSQATDVFEFFCPLTQPTFDSTKQGISTELLNLFRRIASVQSRSLQPAISLEALQSYLDEGNSTSLPPQSSVVSHPVVCEIYHLLADFHLKSAEYLKAAKCYMQDLCFNPHRFDSWAGLALARTKRVEERVNSLDLLGDAARFVQRHGKPTVLCYSEACRLNANKCCLQEQFGLFAYGLSSLVSKLSLPQVGATSPSAAATAAAAAAAMSSGDEASGCTLDRTALLKQAKECFEACLRLRGDEEDTWLHSLMLAKIVYKMNAPLSQSLEYCMQAHRYLDITGVHSYHYKRVSFANTTENLAALASLEVYYRLHVLMLKALQKQSTVAERRVIYKFLHKASQLPFAVAFGPDTAGPSSSGTTLQQSASDTLSPAASPVKPTDSSAKDHAAEEPAQSCYVSSMGKQHITLRSSSCLKHDSCDAEVELEEAERESSGATVRAISTGGQDEHQYGRGLAVSCDENSRRSGELDATAPSPGRAHVDVAGEGSASDSPREEVMDISDLKEEVEKAYSSAVDVLCEEKMDTSSSASEDKKLRSSDGLLHEEKLDPSSSAEEGHDTACVDLSVTSLLSQCIQQLSLCARGFPRHYRSVFRLAHFYAKCTEHKDLKQSRALLLHGVGDVTLLPQLSQSTSALFRLKAPFFQFWKSPIEELERPGSFVAHIQRSLKLLHDVLLEMQDTTHLLAVAQYLSKKPEQAKKYLQDTDRVAWANKMLGSCTTLVGAQLRSEVERLMATVPDDSLEVHTSYPSPSSYSVLLDCLNTLYQVRSTAVKTRLNQKELDELFLISGQLLAPWLFAEKTPEALKSMTREEVIAATVSFQQHYTAAPNAASQASASLPASSVVDGSSQTVPEASVPAPTPSTNMSIQVESSAPKTPVSIAILHMTSTVSKPLSRHDLLSIGAVKPIDATPVDPPATDHSMMSPPPAALLDERSASPTKPVAATAMSDEDFPAVLSE